MSVDLQSLELQLELISEDKSDHLLSAKANVLLHHCYAKYFYKIYTEDRFPKLRDFSLELYSASMKVLSQ